jgi:ribosome-binding factor A
MGQRIPKVESLVQQVVASEVSKALGRNSGRVTVTRVDVSPDMRHAIIWLGIIGDDKSVFAILAREQHDIQKGVAAVMKSKFIPRIEFYHDSGGAHAQDIDRLLKGI